KSSMTGASLQTASSRIPSSLGGFEVRRGWKRGRGSGSSSARRIEKVPAARTRSAARADGMLRRRDRLGGIIQATKRLSGMEAAHSSTAPAGAFRRHFRGPGLTCGRSGARFYMENIYKVYINSERRDERKSVAGSGG